MNIAEAALVLTAMAIIISYHIGFLISVRKAPEKTLIGLARQWRLAWVHRMVERQESIVAVQTLRNWTMSATFLASTAILISAGLLGFLFSADKVSQLVHQLNLLGVTSERLFTFKLMMLVANFLAAFFNFSLTQRYYNYVALRITAAPMDNADQAITDAVTCLERGAHHFTLGMRCFYFAIPLGLWLLGPLWLITGAIVLIVFLYRHDYASAPQRERS